MIVRPNIFRPYRPAFQFPCHQRQAQCPRTRSILPGFGDSRQHYFSTHRHLRDNLKPVNHYEVLGVKTNASQADLKKQFYKLSKETHPDLHKNDPTAADRFSQISESYSVLVNDEKRRKYDRDFMRQNPGSEAARSGTYAGSRPASGLSKRRGTFRGAPPSFHAQGGYGATGRQYQDAQQSASKPGMFNASAYTERGRYDPEFDPDPIFRTQSAEDAKRSRRARAAMGIERAELERNDSFWLRFVIVTTIVISGVTVGSLVFSLNTPRGGMVRADGSRRDGHRNDWAKG